MYPEAFKAAAPAPAKPTVLGQAGEFFKGLAPGAIGAVESAAIGASALLPEEYEKKARSGIASLAGAAKAPFAATPGYEETIGRKFGEAAGSIAPFLLTRNQAAAAGLGAGMGAGEARTRAEQEGATPEQISKATALGSVVGLSEMFAPSRILGRVDEPIKAGIAAQLKRIALAGGEEAAQEAASQAAQNLIAKGIYKPEQAIIEQVGESAAYGGAVGALAQGLMDMALGRRAKKALTQDEISKARADADTAAAAEAARKAEPGYAKQFVEDYDARKAEFVTARSELKKPGNDATPDIWAAYNEQKKALEEMRNGLAKDAKEYNTLRPLVLAEQAKEAEARKPQEIADELARLRSQTKGQTVLPGFEAETTTPEAPATVEDQVDYARQIRTLNDRLDDLRTQAQQTTNLDKKLELSRLYQQTSTALAQAQKLQKEQPKTADSRIANLQKRMAAAEETGDLPAQAQIAQQLKELGVTDLAATPAATQESFPLFPVKPVSEGKEAFAARVYKPGALAAEEEEAALAEERRLQDERDRLEAEREKKIAPEVFALRQMGQRPAGLTNIAAPFSQPTPEAPAGSAAMAMMNQRLRLEADLTAAREELARATKDDQFESTPQTKQAVLRAADRYNRAQADYDTALAEMRQQELIPTGEEEKPAAAPVVRKAPSEGFRLFPRQGAPERPSDYQNLSTRLASALARDDIDQDTYNFLRRAEKVLPTVDQRIETARAERGERGVIRDVSSTEGFLTLLDQQLDLIERNQEGVYPSRRYVQEPFRARGSAAEGAPGSEASGRDIGKFRTMEPGSETKLESERRARRVPAMPGEAERFNMPGAPAAMRTEATTGTTLRTPAAPLSLAGELEPLLRLQEQLAGPDLTETTQGELFPSQATGVVRASFENLVKFMQSKAVQALRTALPKTAADVAKQEKALPALKARVEELQKRLTAMEEAARDYKTAQQVLKSNKDLVNTERDIQSVQKAITANVTSRINLEKQIQDLGAEIRRLTEARQELVAPVMSVTKLKEASGKIGMGRGEIRPYQPRDVETDPVLGAQLVNLEQRTTDLQGRMQELLNERNTIDGALAQLDNYVKVIYARNKVTELQEKAPFGYELDAAKEELFNAQRAAGIVQQEISKGKAEIAATAGQERRRQEAIDRAKKLDESVARAKEEQKRLEAMYSQEVTGEQVQFDPEVQARRMAAEMGAPDYTPTERIELMKDPNKVLGGLNSEVTKLQKQIAAAKNASIAARKAELAPLQARLDGLESAYKVAQDSGTRAALIPQIEDATVALQTAVDRQATEPLTFKGQKKMISDLAIALNKAEDLETKLGVGRVVDKNAPERAAPIFKPSKQEQAAAAQERQRLAAEEAAKSSPAPATSGEALTKSEAKKAGAAQSTVYTGKGVGTDTANPMAKGKKGFEFSRGVPKQGQTVASLQKELDKAVGGEGLTSRKVKLFDTVNDLFADREYGSDYTSEDIPADAKAFVDPKTGTAFMFAKNIGKNEGLGILLHEVGVHLGFRNLFSTSQYNALIKGVKGWLAKKDGSIESQIAQKAEERVEAAKTSKEQYDDELLAYTVEEAIKAGVKPSALRNGSPIQNWLSIVLDTLRRALAAYGINPKTMTAGDLVNMAYGAAQLELRGTWHGSDAKFTAFDTKYAGTGEGAFDLRFVDENSLGAGPYTTPDKEYAEYYQHAVPFGKAANETGYGFRSYQDYRSNDAKYMEKPEINSVADFQNVYESNLLTTYLTSVSAGGELDPSKNPDAQSYVNRLVETSTKLVEQARAVLASREKRKTKPESIENAQEELKTAEKRLKAANTLDVNKIKGLTERPQKGHLYRSLDAIPREKVFSINSTMEFGDRPKIDALYKKYGQTLITTKEGDQLDINADGDKYNANSMFYKMRRDLGIEKTVKLLKDAGIEAIEQVNDRKYIERAYIDQAPEILAVDLKPVGAAKGLLFSRAPTYASPEMETAGAALDRFVAKQKGFAEKLKANLTGLAFETQLVDRFAGFERLKKYMPEHQGTQMMYYLRMYDQRMNMVSQAVATGAPNLVEKKRPDGKTERILEAKEGPSIKSVVEILKDANPMVGNAEAVNRLFTGYLAAIRAKNKGFESLNFGKDVTPEMLADALRVVENNRPLKDIFDKARGEYNAYNRNLIEFVVESGALPKAVGERLLSENDYIPFYREQNGVAELLIGKETPIRIGSIKEQPYLHDLVGGDQPILDFMTSSVQNTNMLLDMGMRNLATKNAVFELMDLNAAKIVRGKPEGRDVVKFRVDGEEKYAVLSTEKVKIGNKEFDTGVPADILVKGMEGIPTQMPFLLRAMAMPSQLLRKGVTLTPLYMARQLFRDSLAAPILAGADFVPIMGALKQIGAPTKQTLERRGIVGGQQFTGTSEDLTKILRDVAEGKPGWMSVLGRAEAAAMEADALTRRAQYNSYIEQGLSEMEATLLALESMNFNKRGASPSVHWANAMIPFFNAQIQGLNVLYKAMSGKMPFNDKLRIREKLLQRGGMMAVASMLYAIAMQDDETYENAEPDQKYGNWFVSVPGTNEKLRVPVPFEIGYVFKAIPEALVNTMLNKHGGEEAVKAFRQILIQTIPGGTSMPQIGGVPVPVPIPQALKPAIEAGLGKSFYTGRDILSSREKLLLPEEQFRANTTEMAKLLGKTFGFSPIIFENLVRGYTGTMGLAFMQALSLGVPPGESPEAAVKRLSEYPVIGGAFQPNDAGGIVNSVYERMHDAQEVARTYEKMLTEGRTAEANALLQRRGEQILQAELGKEFKSNMDQLVAAERAIQASRMPAEEKRKQLDQIKQLKIAVAKQVRDVADKVVELNFSL